MRQLGLALVLLLWLVAIAPASAAVQVGSKAFTESYVLAEMVVQAMERAGLQANHRPGMGGTIILWQALRSGGIDSYPDYTGTISEQILGAAQPMSNEEIRSALAAQGIGMTDPLGFDNTYALVMHRPAAQRLGVRTISDLGAHPDLQVGLSHEFLERRDGWWPLAERYGLEELEVRGLEHALAYPAVVRGELDLTEAYSTDAKLGELDLVTLEDDLDFFPRYEAVFLYRLDLEPAAV